jgi:hypothetical protein
MHRIMNQKLLVMLLAGGMMTLSLNMDNANAAKQAVLSPELGALQSIEVRSFEQRDFSVSRDASPPELAEYARTAIQNDERLRYASPGQGVLHFYCDAPGCSKIRAELTQGESGPVLWQAVEMYRPMVTLTEPDPRKLAKRLIERLASDYEKALKAVPLKINITEN